MHGFGAARTSVLTSSGPGGALPPDIPAQVNRALAEDIGSGDVTAALVPDGNLARATVVTREQMVLCGTAWADETFHQLDPSIVINWRAKDGDSLVAGSVLCEISGPARPVLTGERCALNFLQTLSGTATTTRQYVAAVAGTNCRILDTRKTIPGLRLALKYAVRCGGGRNHRIGLHDMVLIKENHVIAAGSITAAIQAARRNSPGIPVEIETESLDEFREALQAAPDVIMLDEFGREDMRKAVTERNTSRSTARIEASGGMTLDDIRAVAETGIDYISVGALTKHLTAIDLSLRF